MGSCAAVGATWTFFDEEGAQVEMNGREILRAAQQLHYVYEGEPRQLLMTNSSRRILAFPSIKRCSPDSRAAQERWTVSFVPRGMLVEGKPATPKVASPVKIGNVSLTVEMQKPRSAPK